MRGSGRGSERVAGGRSAHEAARGYRRDREEVERLVSPRLRRVLAAAEAGALDELLARYAGRRRRNGGDSLEAALTELLEDLPGSFYPVYNAERGRWELGIR